MDIDLGMRTRGRRVVIGLTGFARSGKDEVGKYLKQTRNYKRVALADEVRWCLLALDPVVEICGRSPEDVQKRYAFLATPFVRVSTLVSDFGWDTAKAVPEVRSLLQRMGTEVGRNNIDKSVWINKGIRKINDNLFCGDSSVVTDVRFPDEAQAIRDAGGVVVRVSRPGVGSINAHASEEAMPDYLVDIELDNSGTLQDLYVQIETKIFGRG